MGGTVISELSAMIAPKIRCIACTRGLKSDSDLEQGIHLWHLPLVGHEQDDVVTGFDHDVVVGDLISITRDDGLVFTYRVTGTSIVDWNKSGIDRHASGFNLILATCYPFDAITRGSQRYLVNAELVK